MKRNVLWLGNFLVISGWTTACGWLFYQYHQRGTDPILAIGIFIICVPVSLQLMRALILTLWVWIPARLHGASDQRTCDGLVRTSPRRASSLAKSSFKPGSPSDD